jgi:hypothetical protein
MADKLESMMVEEMFNVASMAGEEVVGAQNLVAFLDESVAEMAAEKAGSSGYKHSHGGASI